jgi:hypothetical protein
MHVPYGIGDVRLLCLIRVSNSISSHSGSMTLTHEKENAAGLQGIVLLFRANSQIAIIIMLYKLLFLQSFKKDGERKTNIETKEGKEIAGE